MIQNQEEYEATKKLAESVYKTLVKAENSLYLTPHLAQVECDNLRNQLEDLNVKLVCFENKVKA